MANQLLQALLRKKEVLRLTGWSNSTLYNRIADGSFPRPVRTGPRCVAWPTREVGDYIASCIAARDQKAVQE